MTKVTLERFKWCYSDFSFCFSVGPPLTTGGTAREREVCARVAPQGFDKNQELIIYLIIVGIHLSQFTNTGHVLALIV